jgi:hypothetical protein
MVLLRVLDSGMILDATSSDIFQCRLVARVSRSDLWNRTMPLLIVITGKQGAGKSCVAKTWARSTGARRIDVDAILIAGGTDIPERGDRRPTDWGLWKALSPEERKARLRSGVEAKYLTLKGYAEDLVVEGAILCNDWLYESLFELLDEWMPTKRDVHNFYLNVSSKRILDNVHERAEKEPSSRGHETNLFPDEDTVEKFHAGFDIEIRESQVGWKWFSSSEALEDALKYLRG